MGVAVLYRYTAHGHHWYNQHALFRRLCLPIRGPRGFPVKPRSFSQLMFGIQSSYVAEMLRRARGLAVLAKYDISTVLFPA